MTWHGYIGIGWPDTWTSANVSDAETAIQAMGTQSHSNPSHVTHLVRDDTNRRIIAESLWTYAETTKDNIKSVIARSTGKPESEVTVYSLGRGQNFIQSNRNVHGWLSHGYLGDFEVQGYGARIYIPQNPTIVHVTSLANHGEGSLRTAINNHDGTPTFIVFDVSGYIDLTSELTIDQPYLYILGETAPSPGVEIRAALDRPYEFNPLHLSQAGDVHDILVRHVRIRYGDAPIFQGHTKMRNGYNIVFDHCSLSWAAENPLTIYLQDAPIRQPIHDVTVQYCLIAEPWASHPTGMSVAGDWDYSDPDPANWIERWRDVYNITIHHCVFVHCGHRTPLVTSLAAEVINCIAYNWSNFAGGTTRASTVDYVNNYFREGPFHSGGDIIQALPSARAVQHREHAPVGYNDASIYSSGNYLDGILWTPDLSGDDWDLWTRYTDGAAGFPLDLSRRRLTRLDQPASPVQIEPATDLMTTLLPVVGATLPKRDSIDARVIADVTNRTGPSSPPADMVAVGGWPAVEDL